MQAQGYIQSIGFEVSEFKGKKVVYKGKFERRWC